MPEYAEEAGYGRCGGIYRAGGGGRRLKTAILREAVTDYLVDECIQVEQTRRFRSRRSDS